MNEESEYRSFLERYVKLLEEWLALTDEQDRLRQCLPLFQPLAILRDDCPLRGSSDSLQLLVASGSRTEGIRELRDFTKGIGQLTIVDSYFFAGKASMAADIAHDFERSARVAEGILKTVHVVRDAQHDTKAVLTAIKRKLSASGVRFTHTSSEEIHDRVWIGDAQRAVVVGTSFNGLGSRAAFILPLPKSDLDVILEFLYNRSLAHRSRRGAKRRKLVRQ